MVTIRDNRENDNYGRVLLSSCSTTIDYRERGPPKFTLRNRFYVNATFSSVQYTEYRAISYLQIFLGIWVGAQGFYESSSWAVLSLENSG